jgi:hypothetical protein
MWTLMHVPGRLFAIAKRGDRGAGLARVVVAAALAAGLAVVTGGPSHASVSHPISRVSPSTPHIHVVARYSAQKLGLDQPSNFAIGPDGNVYVTDASQRVSVISPRGKVLRRWGGAGSGPGEFSFAPNDAPGVVAPIAVAGDGKVYVGDSGNARIQLFSRYGRFLGEFGGRGTGEGQFLKPFALAVDREGSVYVADDEQLTVSKFTGRGRFQWRRGGSSETDRDLLGHFHFAGLLVHHTLVMANDDVGRIVYLNERGQKVDAFGSPADFPEGACDTTVDRRGTVFVTSCLEALLAPHTLRIFDSSHRLMAKLSPSGLGLSPQFGYHKREAFSIGDDGALVRLWVG